MFLNASEYILPYLFFYTALTPRAEIVFFLNNAIKFLYFFIINTAYELLDEKSP